MVEEVVFTGALERLRVRLAEGAQAPLLAYADGDTSSALQVTRTQHEQRGFEVRTGQSVAIGVRRLHVLPTPLSSFTACAPTPALAEALSRQPLLAELAARMKTRIALRVEPRLGAADAPDAGRSGLRRHHRHRLAGRLRAARRVAAAPGRAATCWCCLSTPLPRSGC